MYSTRALQPAMFHNPGGGSPQRHKRTEEEQKFSCIILDYLSLSPGKLQRLKKPFINLLILGHRPVKNYLPGGQFLTNHFAHVVQYTLQTLYNTQCTVCTPCTMYTPETLYNLHGTPCTIQTAHIVLYIMHTLYN